MIVLSDISALECLRNFSEGCRMLSFDPIHTEPHRFEALNLRRFVDGRPTCDEVEGLMVMHPYLSRPIHLLTASRGKRSQHHAAKNRWIATKLAPRSLIHIHDVYSESPELCFVRRSASLSLIGTVMLGFELCGLYSMRNALDGFVPRVPLTSPEALQRTTERATFRNGLRRARMCLPFILPRSASPMETRLAMILFLPKRYGGYGLPAANLNYKICIPSDSGHMRTFYCDMMGPESNLALEYDSNEWHNDQKSVERDSTKRTALLAHGIDVVTVTRTQINSTSKLDEVAKAIASKLQHRLRGLTPDWRNKQIELRRELHAER